MGQRMKILSSEDSLRSFLLDHRNTKVQIVTAFAYSTAGLVKTLKSQGNTVEVVVGTINAFTDPDFIEEVSCFLSKGLWVDFRGPRSIHWKLYLVAPKTVIVGSANLTDTGLDLSRDTCIVLKNQALYSDYQRRVEELKVTSAEVLRPASRKFRSTLAAYRELHERSQAAKQRAESTNSSSQAHLPTLSQWLHAGNSRLSLFIWERELTESEKRHGGAIARKAVKASGPTSTSLATHRPYKHLFAADLIGRRPKFAAGTVVLSAKQTGGYITFVGIDVVQRHFSSQRDYYISLPKRGGHPELFQLTPVVKEGLKKLITGEELRDAVSLNRKQLLELASLC